MSFRVFPQDARQALRLRRYFMAAATGLLMPVLLLVMAALGLVGYEAAGWSALLVGALIALFFVVFRAGLNLRFADPSLTAEQILGAILVTAWVSYFAAEARPAVAIFYLVALLFGALRLGARRLFVLAGIALLAHGASMWVWHSRHPGADVTGSLIDLTALALILPWFAAMGAYVNGMRSRLTDSHRQLKDAYDRIARIAVRDELTGLYNRRFLLEALAREQARSRRLAASYSVCLFDIDHFKSINDGFGHAAGDAVLRHIALVVGGALRNVDVFGRYGGEEFLLVMPDTEQRGACAVAERVRKCVEEAGFPQIPAPRRITVTLGVATWAGDEAIEALLARADKVLYDGKAAGRNRVVGAG